MAAIIIFLLVAWILSIIIGIKIAKKKNRSPHWMWFGINPMGGFVVCIILALLPPLKICSKCSNKVIADAMCCPFCKNEYSQDSIIPRKMAKKQIILTVIIITAFFITFATMMFISVNSIFIKSTPYINVMQIVQNSEKVMESIGTNIEKSGFISGSISTSGDMTGNASFSFKIKGNMGKGRIYVQSIKENGVWEFTKIIFYKNKNDPNKIDLLDIDE